MVLYILASIKFKHANNFQQGTNVVQVLSLDFKAPPSQELPDRQTGSLRLGYREDTIFFTFRAIKYESQYLICVS